MDRRSALYGLGVVSTVAAIFFVLDYWRRSDPNYTETVKQRRKHAKAEARKARKLKEQAEEANAAAQAKAAESQAAQAKLANSLEEGQKAMIEGNTAKAAEHFAEAISGSDSPMEIALFLRTSIDGELFEMIMKKIDPEVFRDKYFDKFPAPKSGFKIKLVEGQKQRAVYATRDIAVGDKISTETPFVGSLMPEHMDGSHCYFCFAKVGDKPVLPANKAFKETYCSTECRDHAHKEYLQFFHSPAAYTKLVELAKKSGNVDTLLVTRLMAKVLAPGQLTEVTAPIAHLYFAEPIAKMDASLKEECSQLKLLLNDGTDSVDQMVNDESFPVLINKVQSNQFDVTIHGKTVARAIYSIGSFFNHSCVPNMEIAFASDNSEIFYKAIKEIKQGEEVYRCYTDLSGKSAAARQKILNQHYHFRCTCQQCKEGSPL